MDRHKCRPIKVLLVKQSDQGLHCLLCNLYVLETLFHLRLLLSPLDNRHSGQECFGDIISFKTGYLPWTTGILVMYVLETLFHLRLWLSPLDYRYSGHVCFGDVISFKTVVFSLGLQVFWSGMFWRRYFI